MNILKHATTPQQQKRYRDAIYQHIVEVNRFAHTLKYAYAFFGLLTLILFFSVQYDLYGLREHRWLIFLTMPFYVLMLFQHFALPFGVKQKAKKIKYGYYTQQARITAIDQNKRTLTFHLEAMTAPQKTFIYKIQAKGNGAFFQSTSFDSTQLLGHQVEITILPNQQVIQMLSLEDDFSHLSFHTSHFEQHQLWGLYAYGIPTGQAIYPEMIEEIRFSRATETDDFFIIFKTNDHQLNIHSNLKNFSTVENTLFDITADWKISFSQYQQIKHSNHVTETVLWQRSYKQFGDLFSPYLD